MKPLFFIEWKKRKLRRDITIPYWIYMCLTLALYERFQVYRHFVRSFRYTTTHWHFCPRQPSYARAADIILLQIFVLAIFIYGLVMEMTFLYFLILYNFIYMLFWCCFQEIAVWITATLHPIFLLSFGYVGSVIGLCLY